MLEDGTRSNARAGAWRCNDGAVLERHVFTQRWSAGLGLSGRPFPSSGPRLLRRMPVWQP